MRSRDKRPKGTIEHRRISSTPSSPTRPARIRAVEKHLAEALKQIKIVRRELALARRQQTATSEVLKIISGSTFNLDLVLQTLIANATRLCSARQGFVFRPDGDLFYLAADFNAPPRFREWMSTRVLRTGDASVVGRVARENRVVQIADAQADIAWRTRNAGAPGTSGVRTLLGVPMRREGELIGVIAMWRTRVRPFTDKEVRLVETFADQAVIAIQNARLFREANEALARQTAMAEILRVIAISPTDVQPVLDTIAESAARLCESPDVSIFMREAAHLRVAARHGPIPSDTALPLNTQTAVGWAMLTGQTAHVADLQADAEHFPVSFQNARRLGFRTALNVPLMREGSAIGAISLRRTEALLFTEQQVALLETFAHQAVIAIENVRLFTELGTRNRDLTQALDRQTATSEILHVISGSRTDLQPVFDTIVRSAVRLCGASHGGVYRFDGALVHSVAHDGYTPEQLRRCCAMWPKPVTAPHIVCRVIATRGSIRIGDVEAAPDAAPYPEVAASMRTRGARSVLAVPMFRQDEVIGGIGIAHREVDAFSDTHMELLKTFADQAVIAIENARLLKELEDRTQELTGSVEQLTALGEVGRAVSSTLDLETVLTTIVSRAVQLSGLDGGVVFEYDESTEEFVHRAATETGGTLAETRRATRVRKGEGVVGRTAITLEPAQVPDITVPGAHESRLRENLIQSGIRAVLAVPMVYEGRLIGALVVSRNRSGEFPTETIELLRTFATQSALAIQNARLFQEIERKSRQLEAASRHKSEFLANMSHELRTPLNAVIGFSEVLLQRMFGELNEKQDEYLTDIYASGQHLLSLINDILDLSKIEAGRMELAPAPFHLPSALENAVTLVKERAARHGITLQVDLEPQLGELVGDERKIKQVLLNLLSNAVKFTPDGGRITLTAGRTDDAIEIAVTDTGIGIASEDQTAIFEEFRQVGADETRKQEGTGLGLTLARKFVELHGGRIWVESEVGRGSTFTITLPIS